MAQDELREAKEKSEQLEHNYRFCYYQKILMTNVTPSSSPCRNRRRRSGALRWRSVPYYSRYAEARRWRVEIMSASEGNMVAIKRSSPKLAVMVYMVVEIRIWRSSRAACSCYGIAGRIHTSACTVAVMPELPDAELRTSTQQICALILSARQGREAAR